MTNPFHDKGYIETSPGVLRKASPSKNSEDVAADHFRKTTAPKSNRSIATVMTDYAASDVSKLNKLEMAFLLYEHDLKTNAEFLGIQNITLRLANHCRYTPDFTVYDRATKELSCYEVKGPHFWEDAKIKLKVAARSYPWITFYLCTRPKNEPWNIEPIIA